MPQLARIVLHLTKDDLNQGRTIFTDRYYTSIPLLQELESQWTCFTGTCMKNRKNLPNSFRQNLFRLSDGEVRGYRSGRLLALAWRSPSKKKGIIMLSSKDTAQTVIVTSRASQRTSDKPVVVYHYNNCMNGADQYVYYSYSESKKWWRKVCFWLIEVAIVNSYIIFKSSNPSCSHIQYRRSLVESLARLHLQGNLSRAVPGRPFRRSFTEENFSGDPERLNKRLHFKAYREMHQCSNRQKRRRTSFFCKTCPSHPTLCPGSCHEKYHTQVNYKE